MAKVKIQGHASGTGVLTVTAPNTSTDRTITLPDSTGSLIADNGSGQVGIGTTTHHDNSTKLTVAGRINTTNGTATGSMNYGGGAVVNMGALTNHPVNLMVNNSTKWVIDTNGNLIAEGGGGIVLGNTSYAAANALDDYEEGNWTPTWSPTGGSWSGTGVGKYTKIGRQVTASFNWLASGQATGSKFNAVGGLPFTSLNETTRYAATVTLNNAGYADHILMPTMPANSTSINLQMQSQSTGSHGEFTPSMTNSSTEIALTITYMTA